jgi:cysteinyl-tRNA synthetase
VDGKKMSKSLRNYISIPDFLGKEKEKNKNVLRLIFCQTQYRSPINFTENLQKQTEQTLETLSFFHDALSFVSKKGKSGKISSQHIKTLKKLRADFIAHMEDDFNTSEALASIFQLLGEIKPSLFLFTREEALKISAAIDELLEILGITLSSRRIPSSITKIASERELYRGSKQFIRADALRKKLHGLGYEVSDTPLGPLVRSL